MNDRGHRCRFYASSAFLMLAMVGLDIRLAFLHLGPNQKTHDSLKRTSHLEATLDGERGRICDRRGRENILALSLAVKDVCADPSAVVARTNVAYVTAHLAEILDLPPDEVAVRLNRPERKYARLAKRVRLRLIREIEERGLTEKGVFFRDATLRYYPQGSFMCHVLGFVNDRTVGCAGVELHANRYLRGCPGFLESRKNALRQEMVWRRDRYIPALRGADVFLTLDQHVQYFVEQALDAVMERHHAKGAWAIVQRVRTGEILAMASRPAYDPNEIGTSTENARLNRAIGWVYEPGSTFKAAVISAVLNEKLASPETMVDCENGSWYYGGRLLRDAHAYTRLSLADVVKKSSNIGSAKLTLMLGNERLERYLRAFCVGRRLGIDLPGEEVGILHPVRAWSVLSPTRIAIGQGVAVTALQMLGVLCAIANDGMLMKPHVVKEIRSSEGTLLYQSQPDVLARPISAETSAIMRELLARVTEDGGTGRRARLDGYRVAGKTGTAQKPVNGRYSNTAFTSSFAGFLPADDPEIAIIVVADEPSPSYYGGVVAGPAFREIANKTVRYLNIPPGSTEIVAQR